MDKLERRLARLWRRISGGRRKERRSKKDESTSLMTDEVILNNKAVKAKNAPVPPPRQRHQNGTAAAADARGLARDRSKELSRALVRLYAYARLKSLQNLLIAESTPPTSEDSAVGSDLDSLELRRPVEKFSFLSSLPQLSIPLLRSRDFDKLCLSRESGYLTNSPWDISSSSETLRQQRSPSIAVSHELPHKARPTPPRRFHASHGDVWAANDVLHRSVDVGFYESMESYLSRNVYKSKCVTCVFEAANAGLGLLLDDILTEFKRWFVGRKMLVVASELHFSVPMARRCRKQELILKQQMLRSLLENNRRILQLQLARDALPVRMAEARTEENIFNNNELQAVQGVYQRYYHRLLPFVHAETPNWHAPYWKLTAAPVRPRTSVLLLDNDNDLSKLRTHSLVSFNIIGLSIYGIRQQSYDVLLVVTAWNVFDPSKNASRVLRVAINDVGDVAPEFPKGATLVFNVPQTSAQSNVVIGKAPPAMHGSGDALHYYLLPKCTKEISRFSIDERSAEISVTPSKDTHHDGEDELCIFASRYGDADVDDIVFNPKNGSMIRAVVLYDSEKSNTPVVPTLENNTVTVIQENLHNALIPVENPNAIQTGLRYSLDHVQFIPTQNGTIVPSSSTSSLFFVNPATGAVVANPLLADQPQGVYSVVVNAVTKSSSQPLQHIVKKFHYVKDGMKLRYIFGAVLEEFAAKRDQFTKELQAALKNDHPEGQMQVFLSAPKRDGRNSSRTSACFHVLMNGEVQNERSAISALSQSTVEHSELSRLYHRYKVVNIERCEEAPVVMRQSAFQLPMQVLLLVAGVAILVVILVALLTYICFVRRYREHLHMKRKQLKLSEGTPSPLSFSPTFILPPVAPRLGFY